MLLIFDNDNIYSKITSLHVNKIEIRYNKYEQSKYCVDLILLKTINLNKMID